MLSSIDICFRFHTHRIPRLQDSKLLPMLVPLRNVGTWTTIRWWVFEQRFGATCAALLSISIAVNHCTNRTVTALRQRSTEHERVCCNRSFHTSTVVTTLSVPLRECHPPRMKGLLQLLSILVRSCTELAAGGCRECRDQSEMPLALSRVSRSTAVVVNLTV